MNRKTALQTLARAEKAGLRVPVDADQWPPERGEFPLDLAVSPDRCELVAEARRLADAAASRPAVPPEGQVYRHSAADFDAALCRACRHLAKLMKGKSDDESGEDSASRAESAGGARRSRPVASAEADGSAAAAE